MNPSHVVALIALTIAAAAPKPAHAGSMNISKVNGIEYRISGRTATWGPATSAARYLPDRGLPVGEQFMGGAFGATKVGGALELATKSSIKFPGLIDVVAKETLSPASIAKALARPVPSMVLGIAASAAVGALLQQACVRLAGGQLRLAENALWEECVPGTNGQSVIYQTYLTTPRQFSTAETACAAAFAERQKSVSDPFSITNGGPTGGSGGIATNCSIPQMLNGKPYGDKDVPLVAQVTNGPPTAPGYKDASPQRVEDILKGKIPDSNSLPGIAREILGSGGEIESTSSATGPANATGGEPMSTTSITSAPDPTPSNPNARSTTTTTTTTTNNYTYNYNNNTVNRTDKETKTECKTTTSGAGVTTGPACTATDTQTSDKDDGQATDTPLGDLPKLYERKYPEGITGVWQQKAAALKASPIFTLAASLMPTVNAGQCPTFTVPLEFASWASYGDGDFSPPCSVWAFGRIVIMVSALLLARALVFGG